MCLLDQAWSKVGGYLRTHSAHDREGILTAARKGYRPWWAEQETKGVNLETAANFSAWIKPCLNDFPNIMKFQQFEIYRTDDETRVRARSRCGLHSEPWRGFNAGEEHSKVMSLFLVFYVIQKQYCMYNVGFPTSAQSRINGWTTWCSTTSITRQVFTKVSDED